jgi:hypothetical protein
VPLYNKHHSRNMAAELRRKCFCAQLRGLTETQAQAVEAWASDACARHRLVRTAGEWTLAAQRDKARCAKMHARLVRSALKRLQIALPASGKVWLRLLEDGEEAESLLSGPAALPNDLLHTPAGPEEDDGECRTILLPSRRATQRRTTGKLVPPRPATSMPAPRPPEPTATLRLPASASPVAVVPPPPAVAAPRASRADVTPPPTHASEMQAMSAALTSAFGRCVAEGAATRSSAASFGPSTQTIPTARHFQRESQNAVAWDPFVKTRFG